MTDPRVRPLAIVICCVLVTSLLSIGQVRYEQRQLAARNDAVTAEQNPDGSPDTPGASPSDGSSPTASPSGGPLDPSGTPSPGASLPGSIPSVKPPGGTVAIPEFGLKTQGVTPKTVKIGIDYNKSGCGDSGALTAALGPAVTGDPEKAFAAFTRYINDTGGIRGRTLTTVTVDDGGLQCPERNTAAAIEMVDEHKVFMAAVGLHDVGDAVLRKRIPILGGRGTKAEQRARGIGQYQIFQDADSDFVTWASLGKYYLKTGPQNKACFVHPDTPDFNNLEKIMVARMKDYGLAFTDIIRYADDVSTAQQQATAAIIRMKNADCKQVWFIANNIIAMIFFTAAAEQQNYRPLYTFTARTAFADQQLGGSLMNQNQWRNSVGLSPRIRPGEHPKEGNCKRIYERYHPGDGQSGSASVTLACATLLLAAEAMTRAVDLTGQLTANSLMVGVNAIQRDYYWDAHVPMTFTIPTSLARPFDFTGYDHQTVVKWSPEAGDYLFPEYPRYWKVFGPNVSGGEDLRKFYGRSWKKPTRR